MAEAEALFGPGQLVYVRHPDHGDEWLEGKIQLVVSATQYDVLITQDQTLFRAVDIGELRSSRERHEEATTEELSYAEYGADTSDFLTHLVIGCLCVYPLGCYKISTSACDCGDHARVLD